MVGLEAEEELLPDFATIHLIGVSIATLSLGATLLGVVLLLRNHCMKPSDGHEEAIFSDSEDEAISEEDCDGCDNQYAGSHNQLFSIESSFHCSLDDRVSVANTEEIVDVEKGRTLDSAKQDHCDSLDYLSNHRLDQTQAQFHYDGD